MKKDLKKKWRRDIVVLTIVVMALVLLFPTKYVDYEGVGRFERGRPFIFASADGDEHIDAQRTIFELLAVAFVGLAIVAMLGGLSKDKEDK